MKSTGHSSASMPCAQRHPATANGGSPEPSRPSGWLDQLDRLNLKDAAAARTLVTHVAFGQAFAALDLNGGATAADVANGVFNDLIEHEAYDLFVDVFNEYNNILRAHAEADGKPFNATLVLKLPLDWRPSQPQAQAAAFQRLEVQRVHMVGMWRRNGKPLEISAAACQCLATLLSRPSVQEVVIDGLLHDAVVVKNALKSSQVRALDFPNPSDKNRDDSDAKALVPWVIGEEMCGRWEMLALDHPWVLILSAREMAPEIRWPGLRSLSASLMRGPSCLPAFLKIVARAPKLTSVALPSCVDLDLEKLKGIFRGQDDLRGLVGLPSLKRLDLQGASGQAALHVDGIPAVFEHLAACTSLTHFVWHFGVQTGARGVYQLPVEQLRKRSAPMEEALRKPGLPLKSITIQCACLTAGVLGSLFDALEHNTSVEEVDLRDCWLDLRATKRLIEILRVNKTLKRILLPSDPDPYYLTPTRSGQGVRHFLSPYELSNKGLPWGFHLEASDAPGSDDADFDTDLKTHAETLLWQVEQALRRNAMPELAWDVANFMAIAARNRDVSNPDVAGVILRSLEAQGALRSAVHLREVAKSVSGEKRQKRDEDVKPYVQAHNKIASARDLPDAPLIINAVNENGENRALEEALKANKPSRVRRLLAQGAIDFGGKVQRKAPPGRMLDAFIAGKRALGSQDQHLARLPVNRVDGRGRNLLLMAAWQSKDPEQVLRARALGAKDFGHRVFNEIPVKDKEMRAAFKKVAVLPTAGTSAIATTTSTATTSTTAHSPTTTTTTTTTTTATTVTTATQPRPLITRRVRDAEKDNNG